VTGRKNDEAIQETQRFWSERTGGTVSEEDARQMLVNITKYFRILESWKATQQAQNAVEDTKPDHPSYYNRASLSKKSLISRTNAYDTSRDLRRLR